MYHHFLALPVALLAASVAAQTYTSCQPLNGTCPDDAALGTTYAATFNSSQSELDPHLWNVTAGNDLITFTDAGANLAIAKSGDSVTLQTDFYIMWGTLEIIMQAASGTGIISSIVLLSDDLDEIDIEIMGGNTSFAESNWYGHGNDSQRNAIYHPTDGPQEKMHNYTINWTPQQLDWYIDGTLARTVPYAASGLYPQTPSFVKVGIWAGGDSTESPGTIAWAGGATDWSKGPFTMTVQSVKITDGSSNVTSYAYGDQTGSYSSITSTPGISVAAKEVNKQSTLKSAQAHWSQLSTGAKIGIGAGVGAGVLILLIAWFAFCCVQRKKGREERTIEDRAWDAQTAELMEARRQMSKRQFAAQHMRQGEKF